MEIIKTLLKSSPLMLITVAVEYRLVCKTLGRKTSGALSFLIMFIVYMAANGLNMQYQFAKAIGINTFYYCIITFLLYLFLFKGGVVKKLFFTVLISFGVPILFYVLLPFVNYGVGVNSKNTLLALQILEYVNILFAAFIMEYVGRKFQNLRRELPLGYTLYLTVVLLFIHVAVFSGYDVMLIKNANAITLPSALATSVFAIVGSGIAFIAIFAVDRQVDISLKEQLTAMQAENFKTRELERRKLSGFRHDIKNHLLCLNNLLENGKTEQAGAYMSNLTNAINQIDSPVQTGNDYADALLGVKYAEAVEADIKITIDMAIPAHGYVKPIDLCCILSNAFDNAITACKHLKAQDRWITARAFVKQGQLVIEVKNSKPSYVTVVGGEVSPKEVTADHGIGLETVKTVVAQYGGTLDLSADVEFSFSVLLPPNHL